LSLRASDKPLELVVIAGDSLTTLALPASGTLVVGRDKECDVRIDSGSVSRRHAILHLGPDLAIEDLGSRNGTFVADRAAASGITEPLRRLAGRTGIAVGERVNLGATVMVVRRGALASSPEEAAGDQPIIVDAAMKALHEQIRRAARGKITVLLLGETGVGKEIFARRIHAESNRAAGPFVALDCSALPPTLAEDHLFGHDKGAFYGADREKAGYFEAAHGGTLFLDEIGELLPELQVKFLRVLEEGAVVRVGSRTVRPIDVRFVAATNRNLAAEAAKGTFRLDLLHRLDSLVIEIPPLRRRQSEVEPLAERFLHRFSRMLDRDKPGISPETLALLRAYPWPGNVRELRNVIERAVTLCQGPVLLPEDLPPKIASAAAAPGPHSPAEEGFNAHPRSERERIIAALEACAWNQTQAAARLDMPLRTLVNRLDEYQLPRPRKKQR
jgi:DNA-binding NtrC family response regulator